MNTAKLQYPCLAKRYFSTPNSNNDKPNTTTTNFATTTTIPTMTLTATLSQQTANVAGSTTTAGDTTDDEDTETATTSSSFPTTTNPIGVDGEVLENSSDSTSQNSDQIHHGETTAWKMRINHEQIVNNYDLQWKTRLDPLAVFLEESLYGPIIYQFEHELKVNLNNLLNQHSIILIRPSVVYDNAADNHSTPVLKNNQVILKGDLEIAMTSKLAIDNLLVFKGHSKIQFTDSSYHHNRKAFRLVWNYFTVKQDKEILIYSTVSTPFRVFARKPSKKETAETTATTEKRGKKRKDESNTSPLITQQQPLPQQPRSASPQPILGNQNSTPSTSPILNQSIDSNTPTIVEPSQKKVKKTHPTSNTTIPLVGHQNIPPLEELNIRAVPTIVNSVATAVVSHLISQKDNVNQELVMELFKTLNDINKRLERLENSSTIRGCGNSMTSQTSTTTTTNNSNSHDNTF
ncbi:predicted protein [Naegleria gruberi]|uniref:Predicted protein n=1 Tax=Naegleria gruberi TaxID=5762 RepID=D2VTA7_NAEGR|nr:uncharacterized protein NAEGRDRAFT_59159 [Naegleria gruberi]EFC39826.1 predicted protein [Naegleria gruberi]|eukprot:XP_002672570.1 predicted protein [Naegleria gruberi strain NEG-M]